MFQPNWLLSNCQSIRLYPGETRQPSHSDDGFCDVPPSLDTARDLFDLGARSVHPHQRRHRVDPGRIAGATKAPRPRAADTAAAEMDPGSVLWFDAALSHRGGANESADPGSA